MKTLTFETTAAATTTETWTIEVPEDLEVTEDNVLDLLERHGKVGLIVRSCVDEISDEHERVLTPGSLHEGPSSPELRSVWTLVVNDGNSRFVACTVHASEQEARDALRENCDPEGEWEHRRRPLASSDDVEAFCTFFNIDADIDVHHVPA